MLIIQILINVLFLGSVYKSASILRNQNQGEYQVVIAHWLAWRLAIGEVPGLNRGKGENLLISD